MSETPLCTACSSALPSDLTDGLCPKCLMGAALLDDFDGGDPGEPSATLNSPPGSFEPPSPQSLAEHFPGLEILALVGQGGMGAVYKARQKKLDRLVALKVIRPEAADDPAFAERFNREARTLARLNHPHIVAVHDFGEVSVPGSDGESGTRKLYFFIMEFVDGANLRQIMQAERLSPEQVLAIVPQVCEALQFAHAEDIVHRDIKPENILLDARGRVKIADFGLAKLATRSQYDFTLTGTHQVMGTPRYMAPEQMLQSRTVDHRADIYSLGVVLYEMLTGEPPVGSFDPPSRKARVDQRVDAVILKALSSDPERRYQHVGELAAQLLALHPGAPVSFAGVGNWSQPAWPGPSTVMENAAGRILSGVRGGAVSRACTHPLAPGLVALLLSLVGFSTLFLPWGPFPGAARTSLGYDSTFGWLAAALFLVLGLLLFAAGTSGRTPIWRPALVFATGALTLVCAALYYSDVNWRIYAAGRNVQDWVLREGLVMAIGAGLALLLVAAWDLRLFLSYRRQAVIDLLPHVPVPLAARNVSAEAPEPVSAIPRGEAVSLHHQGDPPLATPSEQAAISTAAHERSSVTLTREQIDHDELPDVCMVCGTPTGNRVSRTFRHQSGWAEGLTVAGMFAGVIPGLIVEALTATDLRVACPLCPRHRGHWSRLTWLASTGWLLIFILGGVGFGVGWALPIDGEKGETAGVIIGAVVGLAIYLIPVIYLTTSRITVEMVTKDRIRFNRVSAAFTRAAKRISPRTMNS